MKVAIIHDWLVTPGGAEQVLSALLELFPQADLFTLIDFFSEDARKELLGGRRAQVTKLQHFPGVKKLYPYLLPLMPYMIESINLIDYDLVISSSHAVAKGVLVHPHQRHICYCHTPMRYAWDRQFEYQSFLPSIPGLRALFSWKMHRLRLWDYRAAASVDQFVANSAFIARRIELAYRRKAQVIYPPVEVEVWRPKKIEKKDYYITSGRLVAYKHIHTIVEAFTQYLPDRQLIVVGSGPLLKKIERIAGPNVKLTGRLPKEHMIQYVQQARAYVYAAVEDFGIAPIEALAAGTPVVAYNMGAVRETIGENSTRGLLYNCRTAEGIAEAIECFEQKEASFEPSECVSYADRFSLHRFKQQLCALIDQETQLLN